MQMSWQSLYFPQEDCASDTKESQHYTDKPVSVVHPNIFPWFPLRPSLREYVICHQKCVYAYEQMRLSSCPPKYLKWQCNMITRFCLYNCTSGGCCAYAYTVSACTNLMGLETLFSSEYVSRSQGIITSALI